MSQKKTVVLAATLAASIVCGALQSASATTTPLIIPPEPAPAPLPGHASVMVKSGAVGVIATAATLGLYDIVRRLSCNDFIGLGGPGFSQPLRPTDNVLTPQNCAPRR